MKFYDITRELFSSKVYPGDPVPEFERILEVKKGDACNLTYLKMCAHNGTHMDAPRHFLDEGKSIEELPLEQVMGSCAVLEYNGELDGETAAKIIEGKGKKLLFKGSTIFTEEAAKAFVQAGVELVGVESQTVGPEDSPAAVHQILLGAGMAILEGVCLEEVEQGDYFLCAQPLKLRGCDGAPCRAVLVEDIK
ncbi:MAG: cyclase family protein [Faecalicatena sp.]|uniref:cyclase family protein n=1 Tax=Faecalicatena sp. TaxID=2005360 RepID=UPI00258BF9BE|nr:cyclase family protein [Faecalicatena sp.]MCI6467515.1 cyclase family protein [Faecalicatena sp.]MDY5619691.1 cyclase family protein [Lachnospiraceae bacterium]